MPTIADNAVVCSCIHHQTVVNLYLFAKDSRSISPRCSDMRNIKLLNGPYMNLSGLSLRPVNMDYSWKLTVDLLEGILKILLMLILFSYRSQWSWTYVLWDHGENIRSFALNTEGNILHDSRHADNLILICNLVTSLQQTSQEFVFNRNRRTGFITTADYNFPNDLFLIICTYRSQRSAHECTCCEYLWIIKWNCWGIIFVC